jgi:hypothetical protein
MFSKFEEATMAKRLAKSYVVRITPKEGEGRW